VTSPRARRRLFVALEITGPVAAEVDGLRRAIGSSSLGRIAPHLTLIPPVNVPESDLGGALGLLRKAAFDDPMPIELGPAESFTARSPVLYLAVSDPAGNIARLQRRLDAAPLAAPASRPHRPFSAHVTLSSRMHGVEKRAAIEAFAHYRAETVLSLLTLYEQHHGEARHPWHPLADVVLGAGTPADRGGRQLGFVVSRLPGPDVASIEGETRRLYGGEPVAVVGREGAAVVAEARGAKVGTQLLIECWGVDDGRRGQGNGRALIRAIDRAVPRLDAERLLIAAPTDAQAAFLDHLGFTAVNGPRTSGVPAWFTPRQPPPDGAVRAI
jgi:2'-5' RNA ligase